RVSDNGTPALSATQEFMLVVSNAAPTVVAGPDISLGQGEMLARGGSFVDPGDDTWTAMVDYGAGSGAQPLSLGPDKSFHLNHSYRTSGTYTARVVVSDSDGDSGTGSFRVDVIGRPPPDVIGPTVQRLRRLGIHAQPTQIVLTFSENLDRSRAEGLRNYAL